MHELLTLALGLREQDGKEGELPLIQGPSQAAFSTLSALFTSLSSPPSSAPPLSEFLTPTNSIDNKSINLGSWV